MKKTLFAIVCMLTLTACNDVKVFDKTNENDTSNTESPDSVEDSVVLSDVIEDVDHLWESNYEYDDTIAYPDEYLLLDITQDGTPELVVRNLCVNYMMIFQVNDGTPTKFAATSGFYEYLAIVPDKGLFITTSQQSGHMWEQTAEKWENGKMVYSASLYENAYEENDEFDSEYTLTQDNKTKDITLEEYDKYADRTNQTDINDLDGWKPIER